MTLKIKLTKLKLKFTLIIFFILSINSIGLYATIYGKSSNDIFYKKLDSLSYVGDSSLYNKFQPEKNQQEYYADTKNPQNNTDLTSIDKFNKNTFSSLSFDKNNQLNIFNPTNNQQSFDMLHQVSDDSILNIKYNNEKKQLSFVIPQSALSIDKKDYTTQELEIYKIDNVEKDQLLKFSDELTVNLINYKGGSSIKLQDLKKIQKIQTYKKNPENILEKYNSNFENGLWKEKVADCSEGNPGEPNISMELAPKQEGNDSQSLKLSSLNHSACTNLRVNKGLDIDKIYGLSFDYKNQAGGIADYYYSIEESKLLEQEKNIDQKDKTSIQSVQNSIITKDNNWSNYQTIVSPKIPNNDYFTFYFYANAKDGNEVTNYYDNLELNEYQENPPLPITGLNITNISKILEVKLGNISNPASYFKEDNLLDNQSSSFESGQWRGDVIDCSKDSPGKPDIGMSLSTDSTNGTKSLKLRSANHYACTGKIFNLDLNSSLNYRLSFDYKNNKGKLVKSYYRFVTKQDTTNLKKISKTIDLVSKDSKWTKYSEIISPPVSDVTGIEIYFYAPSDGEKEVENLFDNLQLVPVSPNYLDNISFQNTKDVPPSDAVLEYNSQYQNSQTLTARSSNQPYIVYTNQNSNLVFYPKVDNPLSLLSQKKIELQRFNLNNQYNAWVVDPGQLCRDENLPSLCIQKNGGTELNFVILDQLLVTKLQFIALIYIILGFLVGKKFYNQPKIGHKAQIIERPMPIRAPVTASELETELENDYPEEVPLPAAEPVAPETVKIPPEVKVRKRKKKPKATKSAKK